MASFASLWAGVCHTSQPLSGRLPARPQRQPLLARKKARGRRFAILGMTPPTLSCFVILHVVIVLVCDFQDGGPILRLLRLCDTITNRLLLVETHVPSWVPDLTCWALVLLQKGSVTYAIQSLHPPLFASSFNVQPSNFGDMLGNQALLTPHPHGADAVDSMSSAR